MKEKQKTILIFAYYSLMDPVFQSAVLNYFRRIQEDELRFVLLTFEDDRFPLTEQEKKEWQQQLQQEGIIWKRLRWHSGRFKLIKKAFDLAITMVYGVGLVWKYRVNKVYSEGFPGAILGHFLCKLLSRKHIVHTYEPHADYMLEGGTWTTSSWEYRLLKRAEKMVGKGAEKLITATKGYVNQASHWSGGKEKFLVIPSCIDLNKFYRNKSEREKIRAKYGVLDDEVVLVYLGKFGGMYMEEEFFQFLAKCEVNSQYAFRYWIFSGDDHDYIRNQMKISGIPDQKVMIARLAPDEVYKYLSAADAGVLALRSIPSRRFSSPIKTAEYWACGLPIIIPEGISDDFEIVRAEGAGVLVKDLANDPIDWELLLNYPPEHCRALAENYRSLDGYMEALVQLLKQ